MILEAVFLKSKIGNHVHLTNGTEQTIGVHVVGMIFGRMLVITFLI